MLRAAKEAFKPSSYAVYCCLIADCIQLDSDKVFTTATAIGSRLKLTRQTVSSSLKELTDGGIVKILNSGTIEMLPPDPSWLKKITSHSTPNMTTDLTSESAAYSRMHERKPIGAVSTTTKVVDTKHTKPTVRDNLPSTENKRGNPLTAQQTLELYRRFNWKVPTELERLANTNPDAIY